MNIYFFSPFLPQPSYRPTIYFLFDKTCRPFLLSGILFQQQIYHVRANILRTKRPSKMSYFVRETYCLLIQYFSQKSLIHSLCLSWNTILLRVVFSKLIDPDETTLTIWTSSGKFCHNFLLSLTINFPPPGRFLAVFVHISN